MRNILPILVLVIAVGLFYFYISPAYGSVEALMTQENQYSAALKEASDLGTLRDQLLTKYNNFSQDNLNRLTRIVPDNVNTVKLIADINSVAGKYGITVKGVTVADTVLDDATSVSTDDTTASAADAKPYNTTTISFKFNATYPNLVKYLQDLEKSLQVVDLKSVSFDVSTDGNDTGVYQYSVTMDTYYLKQQ